MAAGGCGALPKQTRGALPPRGLCVSMVPSLELRVASSCALDAYSRVLNGKRLARSFARGTRAAVQVIGAQLKALRCGWTTVDFVGQVRATNAAPSRAQPRATAALWLVIRLSRGSLALLPVSVSCTDSPAVVVRCVGLSIRPLLAMQPIVSAGESSAVTITGKVRRHVVAMRRQLRRCRRGWSLQLGLLVVLL
jgi:hypothetical protein